MSSGSIIDLSTFNRLTDDMGEDFVGELLRAYYDEIPQLLANLEQALNQKDPDAFQRAAHSIKSTSNSFGALEYGLQAKELEMIGKSGNLDGVSGKVNALVSGYQTVKHALEELSNE